MSRWIRTASALAVTAALVPVSGGRALAQDTPDYFTEQKNSRLTYRVEGERTSNQKILLWSLAGATVLTGGLGLYFNLGSRDAADDVRALAGDHTGLIYTHELDDRRKKAETLGTAATVFYAAGGALLVSTVVAFIVTSPPDELREYNSGNDSRVAAPYVMPVEGGFVAGKAWTF